MKYEWDENKRKSNLEKHGLDFVIAYKIYESVEKLTISSKYASEQRWIDIAPVEKELMVLTLVYTYREERVRIISLRKASIQERRLYNEKRKNC
ncbi:MAG: BrnT family toxin [Gammaproteobacteria bacterium]|nr:MAG: BrnT family toxin [Gammaproteobacteria bacterium]RKZ39329.1 MAG: BrnT family toxin [Gammaproteobacteria bacterium]RKZ72961.1 MAG: BrnT family toxin [Gammaproteobacteria bacterium]